MTKQELVAAKAVELQQALAEYMSEEMLENSPFVGSLYYVCDGVTVFSDGDMVVKTTLPELKFELLRLETAKAEAELEKARLKSKRVMERLAEVKSEMEGGAR